MTDFLFEKMFFQAAHIAILEEALETAEYDIIMLGSAHKIDVKTQLDKIKVAYSSIEKLKKGQQ